MLENKPSVLTILKFYFFAIALTIILVLEDGIAWIKDKIMQIDSRMCL
jgi:hypothetical protein